MATLLPKMISLSLAPITDVLTKETIPMLVGLDRTGRVWRKVASKDWELLETVEEK